MLVRGKKLEGNVCESIRLFVLCEAMKWAHLPIVGGVYAQHPKLLDDFLYIFSKRAEYEAAKAAKEKAEADRKMKSGRRRR